MKQFSIYKFTNKVNGKVYIGKANSPPSRLKQHIRASKHPKKTDVLHRAIQKYGQENFTFEVIFVTFTEEDAYTFEQYFIAVYDCCLLDGSGKGYNLTRGGEGGCREFQLARVAKGIHPFAGKLGSDLQKKRISEGTFHLSGEQGSANARAHQLHRIDKGEHHFQGSAGSAFSKENQVKLLQEGRHAFQQPHVKIRIAEAHQDRLSAGTHNLITISTCPTCGKVGKGPSMKRWHFQNCKLR